MNGASDGDRQPSSPLIGVGTSRIRKARLRTPSDEGELPGKPMVSAYSQMREGERGELPVHSITSIHPQSWQLSAAHVASVRSIGLIVLLS